MRIGECMSMGWIGWKYSSVDNLTTIDEPKPTTYSHINYIISHPFISSLQRTSDKICLPFFPFPYVPKDKWLTVWLTLARKGFKLWYFDRDSMWKFPGTLMIVGKEKKVGREWCSTVTFSGMTRDVEDIWESLSSVELCWVVLVHHSYT